MIDVYNKEEFTKFYNQCKHDGKADQEIAEMLYTNSVTLSVLKQVHQVEGKLIRKNGLGVTEEDFRKGALLGLDRRIILRRVRDGMPVRYAINTPRKVTGGRKKK